MPGGHAHAHADGRSSGRDRGTATPPLTGEGGALLLALTPERIADSLRVRETIRAGSDATARARAVLNRVADTVDSSSRFRLDLALTDLISQRALDVAATPERRFDVEVARAPGRVRVELVDDGVPAPGPEAPEPPAPRTELELVAELSDRWGVSCDAVTTIWFEFETGAGA
jgi:hypothetical protein